MLWVDENGICPVDFRFLQATDSEHTTAENRLIIIRTVTGEHATLINVIMDKDTICVRPIIVRKGEIV